MRDKRIAMKATTAEKALDKIISRLEGGHSIGPIERAQMVADLTGVRHVVRSQRQLIGEIAQ